MNREDELKKLDEKKKNAEENLGDVEIRDVLEKADLFEKLNKKEQQLKITNWRFQRRLVLVKRWTLSFPS